MSLTIRQGFAPEDRARAVRLYWQAFGGKLGRVLQPEARALAYVARVMRPDHAISAYGAGGALLGLVGFKTAKGAFVGGGFSDLAAIWGWSGAFWRAALLVLLERDTEDQRFLMDGIFVDADARGQGVGTALLNAVCAEAVARGYGEIRLDVIDSNDRARALYERNGFRAVSTSRTGALRHVVGFASATTMVRRLAPEGA